MNKLRMHFSKWFWLLIILVSLIVIFLFVLSFRVFSIDGTQTCFTHHFYDENKSFTQSQQKIEKVLELESFQLISEGEEYKKWTDGLTYITLNADSARKKETERHRDLTVCTADKKSKDWQSISMQLEGKLSKDLKTIYMQVQLDPAVFGISEDDYYSGFRGVVHINKPVTVEKLKNVERKCRESLQKNMEEGNQALNCE